MRFVAPRRAAALALALVATLSAADSTVDPSPRGSATTEPSAAQPVPADELADAQQVALHFLDAIAAGDIDGAAAQLGPISEDNADAAGGVDQLLRDSAEGHGAWASAADRTVTPVGVEPGLVVVVLEGTLQVEGTTEHRVVAFPVRKAESAQAWFVEPWAYDLQDGAPIEITAPAVDDEEWAPAPGDPTEPFPVVVQSNAAGTMWTSFDGQPPAGRDVAAGQPLTVDAPGDVQLVTVLFQSGPTLSAAAFAVQDDAPPPSPTTPVPGTDQPAGEISVPFLDEDTNALLTACAAGDAASCDAAQVPGVLDDQAFSYFHVQCDAGDTVYCVLFDNLVAAELRMHG